MAQASLNAPKYLPEQAAIVRIDRLTKANRKQRGLDLSGAKASMAAGNERWDEAESTFQSGQLADAVALLKDAKPKAEAAAAALQLNFPDAD